MNNLVIPAIIGTGFVVVLMMLGLLLIWVCSDRSQAKRLKDLERSGIIIDPMQDPNFYQHKFHEVDDEYNNLFPEEGDTQ